MTCSPSRLTTTVLPDQTPIAPLLRFLLAALVAALVMAMGLTGATPVHAAESSLSVAVTEVDVQNYPRALVTVQVGGSEGAVEEVLPTEAFQVSVDGEALKNASVRAQAAEPLPTTTVLLIDESGSMKGAAAAAAAAAAQRFIAAMRPEDRIAVHSFNEEHRVLHTLSGDPAALTASLDDLEPSLETALYDSVLAPWRRWRPLRPAPSATSSCCPTAGTPPARLRCRKSRTESRRPECRYCLLYT